MGAHRATRRCTAHPEQRNADIDAGADTTGWLLEFAAFRLQGREGLPRLDLMADSGPGGRLLGWLTGRCGPEGLTGADGMELPAFS